ncbi:hypothetical protein E4U42_002672 [Claviceps africana]|uniref:Uncharacterized protein n=1 Tax=Claviceps africana TaxID=83212 RepID=A0A8K0NJE4_9HYPO|nr:hypothetical protein E4U42_002672 [Claviceps africana]
MPDEPLELERVSMFGFGAIPNLEASLASNAPLKRRLRPRRSKSDETANEAAELVIVNVKPRQRRKSSSWPLTKKAKSSSGGFNIRVPRTLKPKPKPKPGDMVLPIEMPDGEQTASNSG